MKRFNQTAIAFAIAAIAPMGFASELAVQDSADVEVTAVINQLIEITPETGSIHFTGNRVEDWEQSIQFEVRRQGASANNKMNYSLKVSGDDGAIGENNQYFKLAGQENPEAMLGMSGKFKSLVAEETVREGNLRHDKMRRRLQTGSGLGHANIDYNLIMDFTIPQEYIETAVPDTYSTTLTVMVTAE